ncbi:alpha-L-glutamate ligase [Kitasatospora cinereorecta]|uniref:RimK family alpha-L-glutamate ligase n=1 Tax=Kitasatospora cinereorecta TaxID=285560 RepID=A0ABW0VF11_9ACTN
MSRSGPRTAVRTARTVGLLAGDVGHPLLAACSEILRADGHRVVAAGELADVLLLKARTPQALEHARQVEAAGTPVLNSAASTAFCQDRVAMAQLAVEAGLPFAATSGPVRLADLAVERPSVVKSRYSRRGDLVALVGGADDVRQLAETWGEESVVVQDLAPAGGWDHKIWVVAGRLFAQLRHSELAEGPPRPPRPLAVDALPAGYRDLALTVGEVFGLDVYGVDVLDVGGRPLIVDVNAFPGIRGQAGAPEALAALALAAAEGRHTPRVVGAGAAV